MFKAILSWQHLDMDQFQDMMHMLVISGAITCPTTLWSYASAVKNILTGFCTLVEEGRVLGGAGEYVQRNAEQPPAVVPWVRCSSLRSLCSDCGSIHWHTCVTVQQNGMF